MGLAQAEPRLVLEETQTAQPVARGTHHNWRGGEAIWRAVGTKSADRASEQERGWEALTSTGEWIHCPLALAAPRAV